MTRPSHPLSLATKTPYESATQHTFLVSAGSRTLPADRLALWLSQDRIYAAHAYPRFIGALLSKIPFDSTAKTDEKRHQRIVRILSYALTNIVNEVGFFDDVSSRWGLDIDGWEEREGTRNYTAEMARVGSWASLNEGLVFLWAMEKVYLDAWSFAGSLQATANQDSTTSSALSSFISNWTSTEFKTFVQDLEELVNDLYAGKEGSPEWERAQAIWSRVVELEVGFWPDEGEEHSMRKGGTKSWAAVTG